MNEYSPGRASSEAEVVKAVATDEARGKDLMDKPLAIHYDYASNFIDGLMRGWRGEIDERHKDVIVDVHNKATKFDREELETFMGVVEDAGIDFTTATYDIQKYLDQLILRKDEVSRQELKATFERYVQEEYIHQEEAIKHWCLESGKFKYREDQLEALIQSFLQIRPLIVFTNRQNEKLRWLFS